MSDKQILIEEILPERKPLSLMEDQKDGFIYLKGLFIEGEVQNFNGRTYPKNEIVNAVESINKRIAERGPVAGELDHPEGLNINYERISHLITKMDMEGNNGVGTMRIINAGYGTIVRATIEAGMQPGVSSRGSGNIGHAGMVSDFDIVTVDIVANPSAPNAYPNVSLQESLMCNPHGRECLKLSEWARDDEAAQRYLRKEINKFLTDIRDQITWRK